MVVVLNQKQSTMHLVFKIKDRLCDKDPDWTLKAVDDIKLGPGIFYIFTAVCLNLLLAVILITPVQTLTFPLLRNKLAVFFPLPTLTACETCFATEATINDRSKHQGLRLAFHHQSLPWVLFLFLVCQHKVAARYLQMCVSLMVSWIIAFQLGLISLLCVFHSLAHSYTGVKLFTA